MVLTTIGPGGVVFPFDTISTYCSDNNDGDEVKIFLSTNGVGGAYTEVASSIVGQDGVAISSFLAAKSMVSETCWIKSYSVGRGETDVSGEFAIRDIASNISDGDTVKINVYAYAPAERFIGLEQLCSYFPSSLLFNAPRIGHYIEKEKVPKRAKKLTLWRTKSSSSNDFEPKQYGLVEEVEILRIGVSEYAEIGGASNVKGLSLGDPYYRDRSGAIQPGVYYFDAVEDDGLNFGNQPEQYEAIDQNIKSRFVTMLSERAFYANFKESYMPPAPRGNEETMLTNTHTPTPILE